MGRGAAERGFRARNLEGRIFRWANAGLPVFRSAADGTEEPAAVVQPVDESWGTLLEPERRAALGR